MSAMKQAGEKNLVHFTTDMIYGHTHTVPMTEDHPVQPLGEYGESKLATEELAAKWREEHKFNISIFRPRLIIGPGRLGILKKLFTLVDMNLPVPMIGSGKNPYQFVSVLTAQMQPTSHGKPAFQTKHSILAHQTLLLSAICLAV